VESQLPSTSKKQRGAMFAAKAGNSTLGIPRNVGAGFVAADRKKSKADLAKLPLRKGAPMPAPARKG
jgi:hypothetical protein